MPRRRILVTAWQPERVRSLPGRDLFMTKFNCKPARYDAIHNYFRSALDV